MNITFRNDITVNHMVIEDVKGFSEKEYQVRILKENHVPGLLMFDYEVIDGKINVFYDVSLKTCFSKEFEYSKMSFDDIKNLIQALHALLSNLQEYLLDPNNVMLKKECIFIDRKYGKYEFCYFPYYGGDLILEVRELFSQLLSLIDYDDRKAVRLAYDIQKKTQQESYTLDDLLKLTKVVTIDMNGFEEEEEDSDETDAAFPAGSFFDLHEKAAETKVAEPVGYLAQKETFMKKAGMYFRSTNASEIFDDINELKIFRKIKQYGSGGPAGTIRGIPEPELQRNGPQEAEHISPDLPPEMLKLKEKMMV